MKMSGKEIRETLGFLGVIGSLVFVGLEIRQNNLALTAAAIQESISAGRQHTQVVATNPDLVRIMLLANEDPTQLTAVEQGQLRWTYIGFWQGMQGVYRQWDLSVLPDIEWQYWYRVICAQMGVPSQRAYWEGTSLYDPEFVETVESCDSF
jgi:hypothetical protein